jgi:hypothetical protein
MAKAVVFSRDDAGRIAKVVRRVEGDPVGSGSAGWWPYSPDEGGVKLCKTTAAWAVSTEQELDEYTGTPGSEKVAAPPVKVKAWNHLVGLPTGMWVLVASVNGGNYLVAFSLVQVGGYSATKQQVLGHSDTGALAWLDTQACP